MEEAEASDMPEVHSGIRSLLKIESPSSHVTIVHFKSSAPLNFGRGVESLCRDFVEFGVATSHLSVLYGDYTVNRYTGRYIFSIYVFLLNFKFFQ